MTSDFSRPAARRYTLRMVVIMAFYVAAIFGAVWMFTNDPPQGALRYLVAAAPSLPILGVIWAVGMYFREEDDEYLRQRLAVTSLWATGLTLAAASVWGFLENFDTVPHVPLYYAFVFYWAAFGVVQLLRKVTGQ
ncbi:MAG: hypothetical protein K1X35_14120 [Caulobacteraceae bacterium]|nr:hypothetical protein [Caulobacteraceae bacterium]